MDDFDCVDIFGVFADELVASGESAFTQKIALEVLCYGAGLKAAVFDEVEVLVR